MFAFSNHDHAKEAAAFINDNFRTFAASYRRINDRYWKVEVDGISLHQCLQVLRPAGFTKNMI